MSFKKCDIPELEHTIAIFTDHSAIVAVDKDHEEAATDWQAPITKINC